MGTDDDISEDELLNIPSDNISSLSRLWAMRSGLLYRKQMDELAAERAGTAPPFMLFPGRDPRAKLREEDEERRRARLAWEQAMQEVRDHADRLLLRLDEQQQEIDRRRREIEGRALHLHDGRRVWIDGDRYRDDAGAILQDGDHQEAQSLARQHPDAASWAEKEKLRQWQEGTDRLREKVLKERVGEGDPEAAEQRLSGYEKELQNQMEQRRTEIAVAPVDYGDADYSDMLVPSPQPAFNAAASGGNSPPQPDKKETDAASAGNGVTIRRTGQRAPKLS